MFSTIPRDGEAVRSGRAPERLGSGHPTMVPYRNYEGSDGRYFFAAAFTPKFWQNLCHALDRPDLPADARFVDNRARTANREALDAILEGIFAQQPAAYWVDRLATRDVPCALVQDYHTALTEDPQVRHNGAVLHFEHPVAGADDEHRQPGDLPRHAGAGAPAAPRAGPAHPRGAAREGVQRRRRWTTCCVTRRCSAPAWRSTKRDVGGVR